jgi:hypothetical protein
MNIVKHPHHDLLAKANREREVSESPEAEALLDALMDAARAYWDFLERNHLIYENDTNVEYACRFDGSAADVPVSPSVILAAGMFGKQRMRRAGIQSSLKDSGESAITPS